MNLYGLDPFPTQRRNPLVDLTRYGVEPNPGPSNLMSVLEQRVSQHAPTSLSSVLNTLQSLVKATAPYRERKLAFRDAIIAHEKRAIKELVTGEASTPGPGKSARSGSGRNGSNSMTPSNRADLAVRPPSTRRPTSVPRNIANQIVWDIVKLENVVTLSTGGITEANSQFNLVLHPQATSWSSLFDQWCIPQASCTYRSLLPAGSSAAPAFLVTALDFDSIGNVGSVAALEDFSTAEVVTMSHGAVHTRSVKPCVKFSTQQPSTNVNSGLSTPWCDSGAAGTLHFGIRAIASQVSAAYAVEVTTTIWFAFRNQI